jgi:hypothetical protein
MRGMLRAEVERGANELSVNNAQVTIEYGYFPDDPLAGEAWHWRASLWTPDGEPDECGDGVTPATAVNDLLEACGEADEEDRRRDAKRDKRRKRKKRDKGDKGDKGDTTTP